MSAFLPHERRLLRMSPGPEQPERVAPKQALDRLMMREDHTKFPYAYDRVQDRVTQYVNRVQALYQALRKADPSRQAGLIGEEAADVTWIREVLPMMNGKEQSAKQTYTQVGPKGYELSQFATIFNSYDSQTHDKMARANYQGLDIRAITSGADVRGRIHFNVARLETRYANIERHIVTLEERLMKRTGGELPPNLRPPFSQTLLEGRTKALEAQINATADGARLQSILIDQFREPFTGIDHPAYHLLRVPANVQMELFERDGGAAVPMTGVQEVPLSGGAKYYKIGVEFARNLDVNQVAARFTPPGRIAAIRKDNVDNFIFDFGTAPKEMPKEQPKETPKVQPKEAPKEQPKEGPRESGEIEVNEITPMWTGENRRFNFGATGTARNHAGIEVIQGGTITQIWSAAQGASVVRYPDNETGIRLAIDAQGNIDVLGGNAQNHLVLNFFQTFPQGHPRHGQPRLNLPRAIEVNEIDISPSLRFTAPEAVAGTAKNFTTIPGGQQGNTRVFFPDENTLLARDRNVTVDGVTVRQDGATGAITVNAGGNKNGVDLPIWFAHGPQNTQAKIARRITVDRQPDPPKEQPKLPKAMQFLQAVAIDDPKAPKQQPKQQPKAEPKVQPKDVPKGWGVIPAMDAWGGAQEAKLPPKLPKQAELPKQEVPKEPKLPQLPKQELPKEPKLPQLPKQEAPKQPELPKQEAPKEPKLPKLPKQPDQAPKGSPSPDPSGQPKELPGSVSFLGFPEPPPKFWPKSGPKTVPPKEAPPVLDPKVAGGGGGGGGEWAVALGAAAASALGSLGRIFGRGGAPETTQLFPRQMRTGDTVDIARILEQRNSIQVQRLDVAAPLQTVFATPALGLQVPGVLSISSTGAVTIEPGARGRRYSIGVTGGRQFVVDLA